MHICHPSLLSNPPAGCVHPLPPNRPLLGPQTPNPLGSLLCRRAQLVPALVAHALPPPAPPPLHEPRVLGPVHAAHVGLLEAVPPEPAVAAHGGGWVGDAAAARVAGLDAAARGLLPSVQVSER
jgi:hypothetical protein